MKRSVLTVVALLAISPLCLYAADERKAEEIKRDLQLEIELTSEQTVVPGEPIRVKTTLVNRSKTTSYPVVVPGDGSESGWREPHVFYTGQIDTGDGVWRDVLTTSPGRCGMYDADWHDDVKSLAPGARLELVNWLSPPHWFLDLQDAGRVRIFLHYRYTAGRLGKGRESLEGPPPEGLGGMAGTPQFELKSNPVEIIVVRPLDVTVTPRGPVRSGRSVTVSTILDARLVNREDASVRVDPAAGSVSFLVDAGDAQITQRDDVPATGKPRSATLAPGGDVALYGAGPFAAGRDQRVTFSGAGDVRVAVEYIGATGVPRLRSRWVTLRVVASDD